MANKKVKIKVFDGGRVPQSKNGNWYDCYVRAASVNGVTVNGNVIRFRAGDVVVVNLGFAMDIGKGYEGYILPRSSTFKNTGLLLTNSMGLVDDTYNGDGDEWLAMFYSTRYGAFKIGDRLVQISIKKSTALDMEEVSVLGNPDRGGYGTTNK